MLYIVTAILGLVAGFISANYVNTKRKEELNKVINDLKRKLTLAATRRPSRNYKRNGKKKTTSNIETVLWPAFYKINRVLRQDWKKDYQNEKSTTKR